MYLGPGAGTPNDLRITQDDVLADPPSSEISLTVPSEGVKTSSICLRELLIGGSELYRSELVAIWQQLIINALSFGALVKVSTTQPVFDEGP